MPTKIGGPSMPRPIAPASSVQSTAVPATSPQTAPASAPGVSHQFDAQGIQARGGEQLLQQLIGPGAFRIFSAATAHAGTTPGPTAPGPTAPGSPPTTSTPAPTEPPPAPTEPPLRDTIHRKQRRRSEQWLKKAGFRPGAVDGKMTPHSRRAVAAFQRSMGLDANGYLDRKTYQKLHAVARRTRIHKGKVVGPGQKGKRIKKMQQQLRRLGYTVGKADGIYDQQVANAVKAFKKDQPNLRSRTGVMGTKARRALQVEARRLQHAPERRRVKPSRSRRIRDNRAAKAAARQHRDGTEGMGLGSKGPSVKYVQQHLRAAGYDPKNTRGQFDQRTQGMVKQFQRRSKLPVTGRVDASTWKKLQKATLEAKNGTSPAQRIGERSSAVKRSETLLKKLGFRPGKRDGLYTKQTQKALDKFRKKHKLRGRGKGIGAGTLKAMKRILKKKRNSGAKSWQQALRIVPNETQYLHELGVALETLKDTQGAQEAYQQLAILERNRLDHTPTSPGRPSARPSRRSGASVSRRSCPAST